MFNYILTGECFISDTTIGYPTCHLCSKFYVQFVIKHCEIKADNKYSYARVFIEV